MRGIMQVLLIFVLVCISHTVQGQCLVLRVQPLSETKIDVNGNITKKSGSTTKTSLILLDADQNFVIQSSEDASGAEDITLSEVPKTSKTPGANAFRTSPAKDFGSLGFSSVWRYGLYSKKTMFYLTYESHQDFGNVGVEQSLGSITGQCWLNKDIGGGLRRSVPKNLTITKTSVGVAGEYTSSILSIAYDSAMTTAVNNYLKLNPPTEVGVKFASKYIVAARKYLITTYLPANFPAPFPR